MVVTDNQHLEPDRIAAYLARELPADELRSVQQHMLDCRDCRQDMAEASQLAGSGRPRRWLAITVPAAVAAIALLVVFSGQGADPDSPVLRGGAEGVRQFAAIAPSLGASVAGDSVLFVWRSEGGGAHYAMTVTDENGDVIWTIGTSDTSVVPPRGVELMAGRSYFWFVDALLEGAQSSTTGVLEFTIRP